MHLFTASKLIIASCYLDLIILLVVIFDSFIFLETCLTLVNLTVWQGLGKWAFS